MFEIRLLFATAIVCLAACGTGAPPHVVVDPAMMSLVPEDTVALAGVRLDHLRETAFYEKYVATSRAPGFTDLLEHVGVGPDDLWELLFAHNGAHVVVMARGKFTEGGLEPRIEWEGAERTSHKGYLIVTDGERAITFMNATTAVAGPPDRLQNIIDMRGNSSGPPEELTEMIESIDRSNQIWAVSAGSLAEAEPEEGGMRRNLANLARKIERLKAMARIDGGLVLEAHAECSTAEDASALQSAVQALIGLARFGTRDKPALLALYDQLSITSMEETVDLHVNVPPDLLEELMAEAPAATMP